MTLSTKIKKHIKQPGFLGYLSSLIYFTYGGGVKSGLRQAYNRQGFDMRYGVDTSESLCSGPKGSEGIDATYEDVKYAVNNVPDKVERIKEGINILKGQYYMPCRQTAFLDFGSGKGRALIVASKLGFSSLIGIEFSLNEFKVCKKNLIKLKISSRLFFDSIRRVDFQSEVIEEKYILIYAYNPSSIEIIAEACNNVIQAYPGKKIFLMYTNPHGDVANHITSPILKIFSRNKLDCYELL